MKVSCGECKISQRAALWSDFETHLDVSKSLAARPKAHEANEGGPAFFLTVERSTDAKDARPCKEAISLVQSRKIHGALLCRRPLMRLEVRAPKSMPLAY